MAIQAHDYIVSVRWVDIVKVVGVVIGAVLMATFTYRRAKAKRTNKMQ